MGTVTERTARFELADSPALALAVEFGTPLYVLSEDALRARMREWREAATAAWPGADVSLASKANSTLAVLRIAHQEGLSVDVASEGELEAALRAGVPAAQCHFHGNAKTEAELDAAYRTGVGQIIVDGADEARRLCQRGPGPALLLRLAPGVEPATHAKISTGQADTKFGVPLEEAEAHARILLGAGLPLVGLHCHVGSQLLDPDAQVAGGVAVARTAVALKRALGWSADVVNVGGGLGIASTEDSPEPTSVASYTDAVSAAVREALAGELRPRLAHEPGRSLVAEAGVTLYRVIARKAVPGGRTYLSVDGGLSDNPRPALYGARYDVRRVGGGRATVPFTIAGRHCEADTLFPDVALPVETGPGDLLQVFATGAYNSSMASNYNRFPRPATVLVRSDGRAELVQEREDWNAMFARERVPGDLA